jgi:GT2 family glycosyltransferase
MKNVTAILISFLRPAYTIACIESLKKTYPDINIIVGENGNAEPELIKTCEKYGIKYLPLPYDSGVCVGRNELVKHVETEYILVGDDDFYYDAGAMIENMVEFLDTTEFDLIGGRVIQDGIVRNYQGYIEKNHNHFKSTAIDPETATYETQAGIRYCPADLTFNFFVARTKKVKQVPWDEEIKVAYEHFSWFYDFKVFGGKVAFTPDALVIHKPAHVRAEVNTSESHNQYMAFRNRKEDRERFFGKYGLAYTIGMNGVKTYNPNHIVEKRKNDTKFVDFCITTFKRPEAVKRLLYSIAEHYPMANIYVADQNEKFDREFYKKLRNDLFDIGLQKRPSIEHLEYDCGLSRARNHLVNTTPNKYKLILDDDFEFTKETNIGKMVRLMEAFPKLGIVGGRVQQLGHDLHFEFTPEIMDKTIHHVTERKLWKEFEGIKYRKTGCVLNFALMRKDLFNYIGWDPDLKVTEHIDFYLRMKMVPYMIFYTPDVLVDHPPAQKTAEYKEMRKRDQFIKMMFKKHGVNSTKYENGQVTELQEDGSIKRYKEKI